MTEHHRIKEFTRTSHPIQLSNSFCRFSSTAFNHTGHLSWSQAEKQKHFAENSAGSHGQTANFSVRAGPV
jgi:hypothetical protein